MAMHFEFQTHQNHHEFTCRQGKATSDCLKVISAVCDKDTTPRIKASAVF